MKVYQVYDDSLKVLVTADRQEMLERLYALYKKHEDNQTWFSVDEDNI